MDLAIRLAVSFRVVAGGVAASPVFHRTGLGLGTLAANGRYLCRFCDAYRACRVVGKAGAGGPRPLYFGAVRPPHVSVACGHCINRATDEILLAYRYSRGQRILSGVAIVRVAAASVDPLLLVHLSLVIVLMLIFPISKLLHGPGLFFSPTRNQADNPRERRHLSVNSR